MRKLFLLLALVFMVHHVQAQDIRTLIRSDSTPRFTGYGEMFVKGTQLRHAWATVISGRAGFLLNRKFAFGGVGCGYLPANDFIGTDRAGNPAADLSLKMGAGGIFFEYIHAMEAPVHFSIPVNFTIGTMQVIDARSGTILESSGVNMIEPGINIDVNISRIFILSLSGSYRIARINTLQNLDDQDLSGFVVGLTGRFGHF